MRRPAAWDLAITAAFAAVFLAGLAHHALWRDEILAWSIAMTSPTPAALLAALHYDGHPALWHALLWTANWFTADPAAMKLVHGAIGLALLGLIGLAAPFSRLERVLLLAGYFVSFEYTVISRNYGIGLLLALLYARRRSAKPEAVLGNSALLALLANTNIFAALLSGMLALEYLAERIARPGKARLAAGAALYAAGFALLVFTVWPAADISRDITHPVDLASSPGHFVKTFLRFLDVGLVPVRAHALGWNFALFAPENAPLGALWPQGLAAAALLGALGWIFRRDRALLVVLGGTLLGAVVFGHAVYAVAIRHWGIVTVAFLTCLWMQRARLESEAPVPSWPVPSWPVLALLGLGAVGGAQAMVLQWSLPFSRIQATAAWIAQTGLADRMLAGSPDTHAGMVAVMLGREIFMPECRCTAPRPVASLARDGFRRSTLPAVLAARALPDGTVLVLGWRLSQPALAALRQQGLAATPLAEFTGAWMDEDFYVYELRRPG